MDSKNVVQAVDVVSGKARVGKEVVVIGGRLLGMEVAESRAFSECQVEKVFQRVCLRPPDSASDRTAVQNIANAFEAGNRSLKLVFAQTAAYCMGN